MSANHLHYWLSARRAGSWQQFRAAVEELHVTADKRLGDSDDSQRSVDGLPNYRRLQFALQQLAHVEFFAAGCEDGWRVAPPVLAIVPEADKWIGILCGARLPILIDRVKRTAVGAELMCLPQADAPDLLYLAAASPQDLKQSASAAGIHAQVAPTEAMLSAIPCVDQWTQYQAIEPPVGGGWEISRFSVSQLGWKPSSREETEQCKCGLFRFSYLYQREYVLYRKGSAFRVPVQLGKFIVLKHRRRKRGIFRYDQERRRLSVIPICHPPPLVERALVLCSGRMPQIDPETSLLSYDGISREIAIHATRLLRQEIT